MPLTLDGLSRVTARIADASLDPSVWPDAMQTIADTIDSTVSTLLVREFKTGTVSLGTINTADKRAFEEYACHYSAIDNLRHQAAALGAGELRRDRDLAPPEGLDRSEVCNDFYLRWGWGRLAGGYVIKDNEIGAAMTVQRPRNRPEYSDEELAACRLIAPHLARAVRVHQRLAAIPSREIAFADAVERLAHGVIHLNRDGRIANMNAAAREMETAGAFRVAGHQIIARSSQESAHLRRLISSAVTPLVIENDRGTMLLTRGDECTPLQVVVTPARNHASLEDGGAIVFLTDPDRNAPAPMAILASTYGLTMAESRVAVALSQGHPVEAIAADAGVSLNTIKTHLKNIQMKMGTRRQAETVARLLRGPLATVVR
ncbi:MAG: helix-turn-helix transcriptional regulator [Thermoanaerobaculia bacterium]|nr:helix-turn-helix transcriptional regulator [Thermoanaerobaculia bacterium]